MKRGVTKWSALAGTQARRRARLALVAMVGLTAPAMAQEIGECDWRASAQAQVEPWEAHTRTFANGKTRLTLLDVVEPAAGAYYVMVLSPPHDELGGRQCRVIGAGNGIGFGGLDFAALQAGYDPAVGLIFTLPVSVFDGEDFRPRQLHFTVNQATGQIGADLR